MKPTLLRRAAGLAAAGVVGAAVLALPASAGPPGTAKGPSTSIVPYLVPASGGVFVQSLVTVNDPSKGALNGYDMVGIPDGMGAYQRATDGRVVVNVNHELRPDRGIVRRHGQKGAQAHTAAGLPAGTGPGTVEELQEHGQLLAMRVTNWTAVYGS